MNIWKQKVNSDEFKAEILEGLDFLYSKFNIKRNGKHPNVWEKREIYLPQIKMRLIDVPRGLYVIVYKDLAKHEMAIAYEQQGIIYEALIGNLDSYLNLVFPSHYNVYYLAVYGDATREIIKTVLFPKNRKHIYVACGFLARCMPQDVLHIVFNAMKNFNVV